MQVKLRVDICTELPASCTELPTCTVFLTSEPALTQEFLELYFEQWDWDYPHPNRAASYIPINIFTNQAEQLHYDQSEQCLLYQ